MKLIFSDHAWEDYLYWQRNDKKILQRISNLIKEINNNQVVAYFSKGNETHWLIPINSTWQSTIYEDFDPSNLEPNSLFYYLRHSNSFGAKDKFLNMGSLGLITSSSDSYNIYSGQTAHQFFKNFDQTIGRALMETRNRKWFT